MLYREVDLKQSFPKLEENIIAKWNKENTFKKSILQRKDKDEYVFYDGPPFATGLPHYGHILAGTIKDVVPRFWTMKGKKIERRFGWDCHGLPIENIVEDELKISSKKEIVEKYGVSLFNEKCSASVLRYTSEWEKTVERMGRWVDFYDDYKTMDPAYMESIWWVFKTLWDKQLIYKGVKPMHICPRCQTPLSNFEVTQGYKDIIDTSVTIKFKLKNIADTYFLAWTTTPWTLPGNLLLAVGKDIEYVKVKFEDKFYILAKDRVKDTFHDKELMEVNDISIADYINQEYIPLFDTLSDTERAFRVVYGDFVTLSEGVGVVHCAGMYGEEDVILCKKENIEMRHHVNMDGTFTSEVKEFAGQDCRKADKDIIRNLKDRNILFEAKNFKHSYPHCWRCDTALLNYATSSWFVNVEKIKESLIKNNQKVNWVPDYIKDGRFGKWLEGAKDWAISRARFWGAPLPIWESEDGDTLCMGSIAELEKYSGIKINDLHKHIVDKIEFKKNGKIYKRVDEVLDCWFESGSMPYAQRHYPFSEIPTLKNNIILARHGESLSNTQKVYSVVEDNSDQYPLTKNGENIVKQSANEILKKNKITKIYSSTFFRARQTAEIYSQTLNVPIIFDSRLSEINVGKKYEGESYDKTQKEWPIDLRLNTPPSTDGETYIQVKTRILDFIREKNNEFKNEQILVVTHGEPIRQLTSAFSGFNKREILNAEYLPTGKFTQLNNAKINNFDDVFPAEFIAEGQDQTRGWFYTLMVLGTALFNKPAFKNVIVNGIVLAEDGKKMSKRLKNYPDPHHIFDTYGADALRFYLLKSPVVKGLDLRFSEIGVKGVVKDTILPLWNAYAFFVTYANIDNWKTPVTKIDELNLSNKLDRWIVSRLLETLSEITESMNNYDLQKSTELYDFIDDLTNFYIRRSRRRFWKSENDNDKENAYQTLHFVLVNTCKIIAPFMPFIAEEIYTNLTDEESVHLCDWPIINSKYLDHQLNKEIDLIKRIVRLGHSIRASKNIKVRQPLNIAEYSYSEDIDIDKDILMDELNVKELKIIKDVNQIAKEIVSPNAKILGPKYGKDVQKIIMTAKEGNFTKLDNGQIKVLDFILSKDEYETKYLAEENLDVLSDGELVVAIDTVIDSELVLEGVVRDLIRHIQSLRKDASYNVDDRITVFLDPSLQELIGANIDYLKKEVLAVDVKFEFTEKNDIEKMIDLNNELLKIALKR